MSELTEESKKDTFSPESIEKHYLTVSQFADLYGVSRQTVWNLINRTGIETKPFGNMRLILRSDIVRFFPKAINNRVYIKDRLKRGKAE